MTTYRWDSDALKRYQSGHIIVVAETPGIAREKARAAFQKWLRDNREWMFDAVSGEITDEFEQDDYDKLVGQLEADIAGEPEVVEVLLISGSE